MNRILKLRKLQRQYGQGRSFRLPADINLRKPPRPDFDKLVKGETQFIVLSPTLVFAARWITQSDKNASSNGEPDSQPKPKRRHRRWHIFKLTLLAAAIIMVVFPVGWLPSLWLFKTFAVGLMSLGLFANFFYGWDWAKLRIGGVILSCAFVGGLLGLLIGPSPVNIWLKLLAVIVLTLLFYPDKKEFPARIARSQKRLPPFVANRVVNITSRISRRHRRGWLAWVVVHSKRHGVLLRVVLGTAGVIALAFTFNPVGLLTRLALVMLLIVVEFIFVGSVLNRYRSETLETVFLAVIVYGGLIVAVAASLSDWRYIVFKICVLAFVAAWFRLRWYEHCKLAHIVFYAYDNIQWSIHTIKRGWKKVDSTIESAKVGEFDFTAASVISSLFQLGNGNIFVDSPGTELNPSLRNLAHADETAQIWAAFRARGTTFDRQGAAGQRRSAIMFQVQTGLSRVQILEILPGELNADDYRWLATEGIITEARKNLVLNALDQGKSWTRIRSEWSQLLGPEYPNENPIGVLDQICLDLVLAAHREGLTREQIKEMYPDNAFGNAYQHLVHEGVIRGLVDITAKSTSS